MKKIIAIICLAIMPAVSMAVDSQRAPVTSLTYSDGGNLFFTTSAPLVNAGCTASSYVIAFNNPKIKNYYAMLLSADASNQKVLVRIQGCITLGATTYPRVTLLQVID